MALAIFDLPVMRVPVIYDESAEFKIGKAHLVKDGSDVAIIANGDTVHLAIQAAEELAREGISAKVLDMHTIKPLDVAAVTDCIENIGKIITVEDIIFLMDWEVQFVKWQQKMGERTG